MAKTPKTPKTSAAPAAVNVPPPVAPVIAPPELPQTVTLVCTHLRGRYPKITTPRFPRGLHFHNGLMAISMSDFQSLINTPETKDTFNALRLKGEVRVLGADTYETPKIQTTQVISGRPVGTTEQGGASAPTPGQAPPSGAASLDEFEPVGGAGDESAAPEGGGISLDQ